jgi:hypothetical protein
VVHAERSRSGRALVGRADAADLLAIDTGEQRNPTVGLAPARQRQLALGDLDEKLAQPSLEPPEGNTEGEQPFDQGAKDARRRPDQGFPNVHAPPP